MKRRAFIGGGIAAILASRRAPSFCLALRNGMMRPSAPPTPPLPYAEVEYIERDYGVPWLVDGTSGNGGFDLIRYFDSSDSQATSTKTISLTWSYNVDTGDVTAFNALLVHNGGFGTVGASLLTSFSGNRRFYKFFSLGSFKVECNDGLNVFHEQKLVPDGDGNWKMYFDGELKYENSYTNTKAFSMAILMQGAYSSGSVFKMRIKSLKIGSVVDFIPVRLGLGLGFYNRVDGELFIAEQSCLSAGPDK